MRLPTRVPTRTDILGLYGQDPLDRESQPNCIMTGHGGQDITCAWYSTTHLVLCEVPIHGHLQLQL